MPIAQLHISLYFTGPENFIFVKMFSFFFYEVYCILFYSPFSQLIIVLKIHYFNNFIYEFH